MNDEKCAVFGFFVGTTVILAIWLFTYSIGQIDNTEYARTHVCKTIEEKKP